MFQFLFFIKTDKSIDMLDDFMSNRLEFNSHFTAYGPKVSPHLFSERI